MSISLGGKVVDWRNVVKKGKSEYRFVKVSVIHSRRETVEIPCRATIEVRAKTAQDTLGFYSVSLLLMNVLREA